MDLNLILQTSATRNPGSTRTREEDGFTGDSESWTYLRGLNNLLTH
jgi:hypothetical protein